MPSSMPFVYLRVTSDNFYVDGVRAFASLLHLKLHAVILAYLVNKTRMVDEDIFPVVRADKPKSLGLIEKLYRSFLHYTRLKNESQR